jgi:hypothetical protein
VHVIEQSLEEAFSQVHITNGVDAILKDYRAWQLTISVAPIVLDTFHVPLVDDSDYLLTLTVIDILE